MEMSKSHLKRYMQDQEKVIAGFKSHHPVLCQSELLCCLSPGFTALESDGINCDDAEAVGSEIQQQMVGKVFADI